MGPPYGRRASADGRGSREQDVIAGDGRLEMMIGGEEGGGIGSAVPMQSHPLGRRGITDCREARGRGCTPGCVLTAVLAPTILPPSFSGG